MNLAPQRFLSTAYRFSIPAQIKFEIKSWLGRRIFRAPPPRAPYLHLGCGDNLLAGFENVDFYHFRHRPRNFVGHDLRFPLPFKSESFSGAFSEHTLEHLYPDHAARLLTEVHRVLKPGAIFRCSVPDLSAYVAYYDGIAKDPEFQLFRSGCEAIWNLTQNWGHLSVWDSSMLSEILRDSGFKEVISQSFRIGKDPNLLHDMPARKWESLYIEAIR